MKHASDPLGWLALVVLLSTCEPSPDFATPAAPVTGEILAEQSVVASANDEQIRLLYDQSLDDYRIRVTVPGGAYPSGTVVTVRLVWHIGPPGDVGQRMNWIVGGTVGYFSALQVLPAGLAPAVPLHVAVSRVVDQSSALEVLHAREGDPVWQSVTTIACCADPVAFDVTSPGLWALVDYVLPIELERPLQRTGVTCDHAIVTNPLPVLLDLSNGSYVWIRVSAQGCRSTVTGPIGRDDSPYFINLGSSIDVQVAAGNAGLTLSFTGATLECPQGSYVSESYVPAPPNSLDLLPPVPADCPSPDTLDGGQPDGGRD